jgi:poly(beta-D-mannuronate) C5 epimerase
MAVVVTALVTAMAITPPAAAAPHPTRDRTKLIPDPLDIVNSPKKFANSTRRHLVLRQSSLQFWRGAALVQSLAFDGGDTTLPTIAAAVASSGQPDWLRETGPGTFLLNVSLTQGPGTVLDVSAPAVKTLRLRQDPELYISSLGGTGHYTGVEVTSWDVERKRPEPDPKALRPFVLYGPGSTLEIVRSRFSYLGSDRSRGAYGVTWEGDRETGRVTTGKAVASTFNNNLFGAYTFEASDIAFSGNVFRDNTFYGLDPHDYTTGLRITGNKAFHNGTHGIVFSVGVTASVVRGNHSYANGANGIVMDERSDANVITGNLVENNKGDGIVMLGSSRMTISGNTVRGNRVGVRVNLRSARNTIQNNVIDNNERGVELYGGAREITTSGNRISGSAQAGIAMEAPASVSLRDTITGGPVGIHISSLATVTGTKVTGAGQGIVVTGRGIATIEQASISASRYGVHVEPGGVARVDGSRLSAPAAFDGAALRSNTGNTVVAARAALPWLAMAGATFLVLAVLLQLVHRSRNRQLSRAAEAKLAKEGPNGAWNPS